MYQDLFLYRCSKNTSFAELEHILGRVADFTRIQIRDISKEAKEEKSNVFSNIISAMHRRDVSESEPPQIIVLKTSDTDFFLLMGITKDIEEGEGKSIFTKLFTSSNFEEIRVLGGTPHDREETWKYWAMILDDKNMKPVTQASSAWLGKEPATDLFTIDPELTLLLKNPSNANVNISSLCTTLWGLLVCKFFDAESVYVEDVHENGKLSHMPVKVDSKSRIVDAYAYVEMQYKNAIDYDDIYLEEIETTTDIRLNEYMILSQNFIDKNTYKDLLFSLHAGVPYRLARYTKPDAPINVTYHFSDTIMRLEYEFDTGLISRTDLHMLHSSFCELLKQYLVARDNISLSKLKFQASKEATRQKKIADTVQALLKCTLFKEYVGEELLKFASSCTKRNRFFEDIILDYNAPSENLYIVSVGKIVVETLSMDRYVKTVMVLRPGDVFGIECLLERPNVDFSYRVLTEMAEVIEIPKKVLTGEMHIHPELYGGILEIQTKRLTKYQKLWIAQSKES